MKRYNSIVVGSEKVYIVSGYKDNDTLVVDVTKEHDFDNKVEDWTSELEKIIKDSKIPSAKTCICVQTKVWIKWILMPELSFEDVRNLLIYHDDEIINWDTNACYTQFIRRKDSKYKSGKKDMEVYFVAVPKESVQNAGMALVESNMGIDVISYWFGEIMRLYKEIHSYVTVFLEKDKARIAYWDKNMIIKMEECAANPISVSEVLERWKQDERFKFVGIDMFKSAKSEYSEEDMLNYRATIEYMGELLRREVVYDEVMPLDENHLEWQMALGGLWREVDQI